MTHYDDHTEFRASPPARADLAQPALALRMAQQVGAELGEEEQGRGYQRKHPRPRLNLGNPSLGEPQPPLGIPKALLTAKASGVLLRHRDRRPWPIAHQMPVLPAPFFVAGSGLYHPTALGIAAQTPQVSQRPTPGRACQGQAAQLLPLLVQ